MTTRIYADLQWDEGAGEVRMQASQRFGETPYRVAKTVGSRDEAAAVWESFVTMYREFGCDVVTRGKTYPALVA